MVRVVYMDPKILGFETRVSESGLYVKGGLGVGCFLFKMKLPRLNPKSLKPKANLQILAETFVGSSLN